jgi:predicted MFS family arabinose efflux permease
MLNYLVGGIVGLTGVMMAAGTLNDIVSSLSVSVSTAGQLISSSALLVCMVVPWALCLLFFTGSLLQW